MQHLSNERQPPASVLARLNELLDLVAKLRRGIVSDQTPCAVQDVSIAQVIDFRFDLFYTAPESRSQTGSVEHSSGIPMEENQDIPRQERPDMALDEPRDRGSQDPFEVVQALDRP